jgi:hypothetical protein
VVPQALVQSKEEPKDLVKPVKLVVIMPMNEYWVTSMTLEANLETLRGHGFLPEDYEWTATQGEKHLTPNTFQITAFTAHCECGFGVSLSKFLERVCRHYRIEVVQMLPNTIAMLSVFAFLCEVWPGVEPYLDLWRYYYSGIYHATKLFMGSVGFSL